MLYWVIGYSLFGSNNSDTHAIAVLAKMDFTRERLAPGYSRCGQMAAWFYFGALWQNQWMN